VHHPDYSAQAGTRRRALTQTIDLMPTILEMFGAPIPPEVRGRSLLPVLERDRPVREAAVYGQFGGATNVTDGRYTYFRYPEGTQPEMYHYTLMPTHMRTFFEAVELQGARLAPPFDWTKGEPVLQVPVVEHAAANMVRRYPLLDARTVLYDVQADPAQQDAVADKAQEARLLELMRAAMREHDAPLEAYVRLGLSP
jgi:arylsulfatase A-like enzyme